MHNFDKEAFSSVEKTHGISAFESKRSTDLSLIKHTNTFSLRWVCYKAITTCTFVITHEVGAIILFIRAAWK